MKKILFLCGLLAQITPTYPDWHTIYAHGIVDNATQMQRFTDAICTQHQIALEFCDAQPTKNWYPRDCASWLITAMTYAITSKEEKIITFSKMYMGQDADIETIQKSVQNIPKNESIILYGCSRGSAAIINYLAEHNPKSVQAIVLDGTPANMPSNLALFLAKLGINPKHANTIFSQIFPAYPKDSIPPIHAIKEIQNKNLPILLIHSKTDDRVLVHNSYQLYLEFKRHGFTNVHLIILPTGKHSYLLQDEAIKHAYLQAVHSFYKKYHAPYDANWTTEDFDLDAQMPSLEEMQTAIMKHDSKIKEAYESAIKRNIAISLTTAAIVVTVLIQKYLN